MDNNETLSIRDTEDIRQLTEEIEEIKALVSFGQSSVGKKLISQRENKVISIINKLLRSLSNDEDQTIQFYVSNIAQLKVAISDLVDFKGSSNSLEDRQVLLDTILKKKN